MKTIELSNYTVDIKDAITWGDKEAIKSSMLSGAKISANGTKQDLDFDASIILNSQYKAIEICILKITDNDGKEISYSREWMNGLSVEDGDVLCEAINIVTNPVKK